jgi:hypothetical protein
MKKESTKTYLDRSFKNDDDIKWQYLLSFAFDLAEEVSFNILSRKKELPQEIKDLYPDLILRETNFKKLYPTKNSISFNLTERLKTFILSKSYSDWNNYYLEDISFYKNNQEFFATITHENYIVIIVDENQIKDLNTKGFRFEEFSID